VPDPAVARLYDDLFGLYVELYPRTENLMHRLGQ
jgi:hypothetical protein